MKDSLFLSFRQHNSLLRNSKTSSFSRYSQNILILRWTGIAVELSWAENKPLVETLLFNNLPRCRITTNFKRIQKWLKSFTEHLCFFRNNHGKIKIWREVRTRMRSQLNRCYRSPCCSQST